VVDLHSKKDSARIKPWEGKKDDDDNNNSKKN